MISKQYPYQSDPRPHFIGRIYLYDFIELFYELNTFFQRATSPITQDGDSTPHIIGIGLGYDARIVARLSVTEPVLIRSYE